VRERGLNASDKENHPVVTETQHFDGVIYGAGSTIVRMIRDVLGLKKFFKALKFYLNKHKFNTTTHEDLIFAFEKASFACFRFT
jgi:aminopeptidase N